MDIKQFYIFLEEEHKTDPHKIKNRKIFIQTLKNKLITYYNLPTQLSICGICLEDLSRITTIKTKCCHYFHDICLNKWKNKNRQEPCPLCRTVLVTPSLATFSWNIKENNIEQSNKNTHIDFNKIDDYNGNITYSLNLVVTGGMDSKGTVEYKI